MTKPNFEETVAILSSTRSTPMSLCNPHRPENFSGTEIVATSSCGLSTVIFEAGASRTAVVKSSPLPGEAQREGQRSND